MGDLGVAQLHQFAGPLWDLGLTGKGVDIALLDTGVHADHFALQGKVADFAFFNDQGVLESDHAPFDTAKHGTHLAGIICGDQGIGVAPDARLHVASVINSGWSLVRILAGLEWALKSPARIVVLAVGSSWPNPVLFSMIEALRNTGKLVICPIGNGGKGRATAPGIYSNVLSVGTVNPKGDVASFSGSRFSDGQCAGPDILAPGVNLKSALLGSSEFITQSGTSQSAAFVAGIAALVLQDNPHASVFELERALKHGCFSPQYPDVKKLSVCGVIDPIEALRIFSNNTFDAQKHIEKSRTTARFVDPVLRRSIATKDTKYLGCVVVARQMPRQQISIESIISEIESASKEKITEFRTFSDSSTALITASTRFICRLVEHKDILIASSPRLSTNPFFG